MTTIPHSGLPGEPSHDLTVVAHRAPAQPRPTIYLSDLIAAVDRRRWPALLAFALAVGAVVVLSQLAPAKYTSFAEVMIDTRQREVVKLQAVLSGLPPDSPVIDSEVEVIRSRGLADNVVTKLGLDRDPEFSVDARSQPNAAVRRQQTIDAFLSQLGARRLGQTYVIEVTFRSADRNKAARIANAVADAYLAQQQTSKYDATRGASAWLTQRVKEMAQRVREAEEKVVAYKAEHGLMSAEGVNLTESAISELNAKLAEARAEQAQKEARLSAAQQQLRRGNGGSLGDVTVLSGTIQELRKQEADVVRRQADMETRYGESHPELIKVRQEKKELDSAVSQEIQRIIGSLQADAIAARGRTTSLEGSLGTYRGTLANSNEAAVRLNELERNAQAERTLYEAFLGRLQQTSAQTGSEVADAQIISRAAPSRVPSFPSPSMVTALALLLGVGLSATTVVVAEMRDRSFKSADEVEDVFGLPVIECVPATRQRRPADLIVAKPLSRFTEVFRNLKTSALFGRAGKSEKIIALTSALPGEGKTTCALALGRTMSLTRPRVLIVDCDVRACSLTNLVAPKGTKPQAGILEVLAHRVPLDEVLLRDEMSAAMILPAVHSDLAGQDLFLSDAADRFFDLLANCFDVIILDTPPLLPVADARIIVQRADAVLLLARWYSTSRFAVADALRLLRGVGADISGILLTRVDLRKQSRMGLSVKQYDYARNFSKYYRE